MSEAPLLRVVRGDATAEETAALVIVVQALAARPAPPSSPARRPWSAPSRLVRAPLAAGPGSWRASALPR